MPYARVLTIFFLLAGTVANAQAPRPVMRVTVTTSDGTTLQITNPIYQIEQSSTAPGYVIGRGPYVTSTTGLEYLPFELSWGEALVPFHLIKSVSRESSSDKSGGRLRVELRDGSILSCALSGFAQYRSLAGEGSIGPLTVRLQDIKALAFETSASTSRTVSFPKGRPSGPFVVSTGTESITVSTLSAAVVWPGDYVPGITLREWPWKIGQLSFTPDFARIKSIDLKFPAETGSSLTHTLEVTLDTGEKLVDRGAGEYNGPMLLGASNNLGIVLVRLSNTPIHVERASR